jgi:hypothetical protein
MANAKENKSRAADIIKNRIRNCYTIEFLGTWEQIHNPNFNMQAGLNAEFIKMGLPQPQRPAKLNQTAISQMKSLVTNLLRNLYNTEVRFII